MVEQEKPYLSYLLRLWLAPNQTHAVWRCSLENVQTGERQGFASLEALCAFLGEKISPLPENCEPDDCLGE